ncbi:MAG: hypothetical protein HUU20_09165 [Pirellulales bacterium]|nr:hypothetical protein [Pirellulales bacterium]
MGRKKAFADRIVCGTLIAMGIMIGLRWPAGTGANLVFADADPPREGRSGAAPESVPRNSQTDNAEGGAGHADRAVDSSAIPAKTARYAQRLLERYDKDHSKALEKAEWQEMRGEPSCADRDRNGVLSLEELIAHVAEYGRERKIRLLPPQPGDLAEMAPLLNPEMVGPATADEAAVGDGRKPRVSESPSAESAATPPDSSAEQPDGPQRRDTKFYVPASRLPSGLPASFLARDADGDGQLTLAEFAPKKSKAELDEFARLDRNSDGVITAAEYLGRSGPAAENKPSPQTEENSLQTEEKK